MISLGNLAQDMMSEERVLEDKVKLATKSLDPALMNAAILECLLAIHKRQRDGIMLALRTSNG